MMGILKLLFTGGVECPMGPPPYRPSREAMAALRKVWPDWITHLRVMTTADIVYTKDQEACKDLQGQGLMRKRGKEWKSTRMATHRAEILEVYGTRTRSSHGHVVRLLASTAETPLSLEHNDLRMRSANEVGVTRRVLTHA